MKQKLKRNALPEMTEKAAAQSGPCSGAAPTPRMVIQPRNTPRFGLHITQTSGNVTCARLQQARVNMMSDINTYRTPSYEPQPDSRRAASERSSDQTG
jgi:hypothetical protein